MQKILIKIEDGGKKLLFLSELQKFISLERLNLKY